MEETYNKEDSGQCGPVHRKFAANPETEINENF
jgi:hypothetical protein